MIRSPFKSRGYYVFNYQPRYYDARKERLEKLKTTDENKPTLKIAKNQLIGQWSKTKKNMGAERKVLIRMALIISILTGLIAYAFGLHHII